MTGVAVIGYGYWGPNLARNFSEAPACDLRAVCDKRPERLALARRRHPTTKATAELSEILGDPTIEAVAIATPVATHFATAREALRAGKHVLVEKPLASSSVEAEELIAEAERTGRILMVDHTFLYTGAVRKIKELISSGHLGRVHYYDSIRINLGLFQHDVNVLWDLAVHDLSIADHLIGEEVVGVSALGASHVREGLENVAYLTLLYSGNVLAHLHVNWLAPVKIRRTLISGSRRMVVYDDVEPSEKVKVYDSGVDVVRDESSLHKMLVSYRVGDMNAPRLDTTEALQTEVNHFLDCVRSGEKPLTDGEAGRRIVALLEAASESMRNRGRLVEVRKGVRA